MRILIATLAFMAFGFVAPADAATLKDNVQVTGATITLGDVFDGAGDAASRAIAQAPAQGQSTTLSPAVLAAAAAGAGLDWTAPANFTGLTVTRSFPARSSGIGATIARRADDAQLLPVASSSSAPVGNATVHRGDSVLLLYRVPGITLSIHARALEDGAVGQDIRFVNLTSNRTVDAVVTGPAAAEATALQ